MGYVFISYSSKNQQMADSFKALFNQNGIRTWMAPGDIPFGATYTSSINTAIKNSSSFVLLLSESAQGSPWVLKETERAVSAGKTIFTVLLDDVSMNDDFEFMLSTSQAVAIRKIDGKDEKIQQLIAAIKIYTGEDVQVKQTQKDAGIENSPSLNVKDNGGLYGKSESEDDLVNAIKRQYPQYFNVRFCEGSLCNMYRAFDCQNNMEVAIKVYSSEVAVHIPFFFNGELFWDIKKLKSDHLCTLVDRKLREPMCLVTRYVQGETLEAHIKAGWLWKDAVDSIIKFSLNVLWGLAALHNIDIYYGDLTPRNIIVDKNNIPRLCDFSESNYNGSRYIDKTILIEDGKYRSPEKEPGKNIDFRSDIYEFGIILLDFLPFIRHDDNVRDALFEIAKKATKENPDERYQSVKEIINLLNDIWMRRCN